MFSRHHPLPERQTFDASSWLGLIFVFMTAPFRFPETHKLTWLQCRVGGGALSR